MLVSRFLETNYKQMGLGDQSLEGLSDMPALEGAYIILNSFMRNRDVLGMMLIYMFIIDVISDYAFRN